MIKWLQFVLLAIYFPFNAYAQNALSFVSTSSTVTTNQPAITGNAARTVEAWIKVPNPSVTTQQVLIDMGATSPNGSRFTLNIINGHYLRIEIAGNGFTGTTDITDNNWHHVAVTYNPANAAGQKAKLYIDGMLEAQKDFTVTMNTSSGPFRIGSRSDGASYFNGTMDEVRIWNVERTAAEILADKDREFCMIPGGLIAYYKFNEGIAGGNNTGISTVANSANGSFTGTLNSFNKTGSTSNFVTGAPVSGNTFNTITAVECASYTAPSNTHTYTSSGTYYDTIPNTTGYDSILTINLTIAGSSPLTSLAATNVTSSSALLTWDSVAGATGYEYALTSLATPPASGIPTSDTFYAATGLTHTTTYYFHVRARCSNGLPGVWTTISFKTAPACYPLTGVTISGITQTGASFSWNADTDATWYEYFVTGNAAPPAPPLAGSGTYKTNYVSTSLSPGSTYFFHVRKRCNNTLLSSWITEQFTTLNVISDIDELKEQLFSISPNPTTGRIAITMSKERSSREAQIIVTDIFGKLIQSLSTDREVISVDLGDQASGMYFVRMTTGDRTQVKQVILNR